MFTMFHHYKTKHVIYIHLLCIKLHLSVYNDVTDTVNDVWPLKQNVGQYSYQKVEPVHTKTKRRHYSCHIAKSRQDLDIKCSSV